VSIGKLDGLTGSALDRSKSPKRLLQEQFARVMVQELRASLPEEAMGGPFGDAFGSVFDDAMAKAIVDGGGMEINWGVQDSQRMANPLPDGARISSGFGMREAHPIHGDRRMHNGVDLAAPRGSEIGAVRAGTVLRVKRSEHGYGNQVMVDHGEGMVSRYAHCQDIFVKVGDQLEAGQLLGTVGSSGASTGPHLHLEVHVDGQAVDPVPYMPEGSVADSDHDSHR
jgi:murein DD-endopeptidase MepM/ murein hydrolase activator NlpD